MSNPPPFPEPGERPPGPPPPPLGSAVPPVSPGPPPQGLPGAAPGWAPPPSTNGLAIASLVVGVLSLPLVLVCVGWLTGVVAIVLGVVALRSLPPGTPGRGPAVAGIVTGGMGVVLGLPLLIVGVMGGLAGMGSG